MGFPHGVLLFTKHNLWVSMSIFNFYGDGLTYFIRKWVSLFGKDGGFLAKDSHVLVQVRWARDVYIFLGDSVEQICPDCVDQWGDGHKVDVFISRERRVPCFRMVFSVSSMGIRGQEVIWDIVSKFDSTKIVNSSTQPQAYLYLLFWAWGEGKCTHKPCGSVKNRRQVRSQQSK